MANDATVPVEAVITEGLFPTFDAGSRAYFNTFQGVTNSAPWALYKQLYDEYRVLALEVMVCPTASLPSVEIALNTFEPIRMGLYSYRAGLDVPAIPSTFPQVAQFDDFMWCNTTKSTSKTIRMSGTYESNFVSTEPSGTPQESDTGVGLWLDNILTGEYTYTPSVVVKWRVQFRSTKPLAASLAAVSRTKAEDVPKGATAKPADAAALAQLALQLLAAAQDG